MSGISILIVEDEAMTAMYLGAMLRRKGYNVLKCISTGEEAVEYVISKRPDLVLMDIRLAGDMDGIEAMIKIVENTSSSVQFIFTTGYSDLEYRERALELNPAGFLVKPINTAELIVIIESNFIHDRDSGESR